MEIQYGLTEYGFNRKRLDEIKKEKEKSFKNIFGENINLSPQSNFGQIIGIEAESEALVWEIAELVYNAFYPATAQGVQLSNLVTLNGIQRKRATYSKVVLSIIGLDGTKIPAGSLVSIPNNSEKFSTDIDVVISSGVATVEATAVNSGKIIALAGSITQIDNPVFGWQSVTNLADAKVGTDEETDAELRARRSKSTKSPGQNMSDALFAQLLNLDNVSDVRIISNGTDTTSSDGIPAHQFLSIVNGGLNSDIAKTIWINTPQGIMSYGDVTEKIIDSQGFEQNIRFSRPIIVDIFFTIVITVDSNYPATGDEDIKDNIVKFGESNNVIGKDIILSQFYTPVNLVKGVISISIRIGPNPFMLDPDNIQMAYNALANYDKSNIIVTHI